MFIDNFYTSPKLVNDLIKKGTFSVEIVHPNRKSDQYHPGAWRQLCFDTSSASAVTAGLASSHTDVSTKLYMVSLDKIER